MALWGKLMMIQYLGISKHSNASVEMFTATISSLNLWNSPYVCRFLQEFWNTKLVSVSSSSTYLSTVKDLNPISSSTVLPSPPARKARISCRRVILRLMLVNINHTWSISETGWWFGTFLFFHILGISSSQLTNSYFSEEWLNHQPGMEIFEILCGSARFCIGSWGPMVFI